MNYKLQRQFFSFATTIETLKKMERFRGQFFWKDYPERKRYESMADHSWRVAVLVLLFESPLSKPFNAVKALKMALIHDLPEVIAGDASPLGVDGTGKNTHAFNKQKQRAKRAREARGAHTLFNKLPGIKKREFLSLWLEYEEQKSFESRVIKALDRIECLLQVLEYRKGKLFPKHLDFTLSYGLQGSSVDPAIEAFGALIAEEFKKGYK